MSRQLDTLIAILRDNANSIAEASLCPQVYCGTTNCDDCPFNDEESVNNLVKELEVLQHAKA